MQHLYLANLSGMTEEEVKKNLADNYAGTESGFSYGDPSDTDREAVVKRLEEYEVCVAYEHTGDYGCDSAAFYIFRNIKTGAFGFVSGGHCSCYGFEGQFKDMEEMPNAFFHQAGFYLSTGGYDDESNAHVEQVKQWIKENIPAV